MLLVGGEPGDLVVVVGGGGFVEDRSWESVEAGGGCEASNEGTSGSHIATGVIVCLSIAPGMGRRRPGRGLPQHPPGAIRHLRRDHRPISRRWNPAAPPYLALSRPPPQPGRHQNSGPASSSSCSAPRSSRTGQMHPPVVWRSRRDVHRRRGGGCGERRLCTRTTPSERVALAIAGVHGEGVRVAVNTREVLVRMAAVTDLVVELV